MPSLSLCVLFLMTSHLIHHMTEVQCRTLISDALCFTSLGGSGRAGDADSFATGRRRDHLSDAAHPEAEGHSANPNSEYGWHLQFSAHGPASQCRQLPQIGW